MKKLFFLFTLSLFTIFISCSKDSSESVEDLDFQKSELRAKKCTAVQGQDYNVAGYVSYGQCCFTVSTTPLVNVTITPINSNGTTGTPVTKLTNGSGLATFCMPLTPSYFIRIFKADCTYSGSFLSPCL